LAYCQGCGTGYHDECTSLARGRCPILGCVGLLGATETAPRFALALDPGEGDLDESAVGALAEFLEVDAYDARLKCQLPIPSVLRWCSAEELEVHQRALAAQGIRTFAARGEELTEALYPVQAVSLDGTSLEAWDGDGSGKGVQVDCESAGFVVLGRYEDRCAPTRNQGPGGGRPSPGADIARRQGNSRFVHVYPDSGSQPLEFSYERIKDHRYLGDSMEPSGVANFEQLAGLLSKKARANDTLLTLSGRLVTVSVDSTQRTSTNRPWALAASRLLWLADQERRLSSGEKANA
jgi:hypothetical protein